MIGLSRGTRPSKTTPATPNHPPTAAIHPHPPETKQADVDVLVEDARKMAVEVEHKVASANVFADQVGLFSLGHMPLYY